MGTTTIFDQPYPLVTLDEAKTALGESGDDRNIMIDGMILAAQGEMDGPKGWLGMSVAVQGLEYRVDDFSETICLPFGPITDQVDVYYLDADGAEQVLAPTVYEVVDGKLVLVSGESWPSLYDQEGAVRIRYYAGIEDSFDHRIAIMKTAILLHVRMTMDGDDPVVSRRAIESIVMPLWVARC